MEEALWEKKKGTYHATNYILKFIFKNRRIKHKVKKKVMRKEGDCVKVMGSDVKFF